MRYVSFALLTALLASGPVSAACFGSDNYYTCTDNAGNSYNVSKFGNSTSVQGYNSGTGSNWSQQSFDYGNSTQTYGTASNGRSWNMQTQTYGGMTTYSGTDSGGNSFYNTCTIYGCN